MSEELLLHKVRALMAIYALSSMSEHAFVNKLFEVFENDPKSPHYNGLVSDAQPTPTKGPTP